MPHQMSAAAAPAFVPPTPLKPTPFEPPTLAASPRPMFDADFSLPEFDDRIDVDSLTTNQHQQYAKLLARANAIAGP